MIIRKWRITNMTKAAWSKAVSIDYKYTNQMWTDLCNLLTQHYKVKSINKNEVFLHIPKAAGFDIEIYPGSKSSVHKFSIHVWNLGNDEGINSKVVHHKEVDSLSTLIIEVDEIIKNFSNNMLNTYS